MISQQQYDIEVKNLQIAYDNHIIIPKLDLKVPKGKISIIIGSNGCGKSTLLKTIARILKPKDGEVLLCGADLKKHASKEIAKHMAVLPQGPSMPSGLLVKELVSYGRFPYQSPMGGLKEHDLEMIHWAMKVTGIENLKERAVESLSGGQRQRVWIAMALAQETDILILDEPTTFLDMSHQLEILQLLKNLNKEKNKTIVMVLHELNITTKFADYIFGMKGGKIIFEGEPKKVITRDNLRALYDIEAKLQMDESNSYPICMDFELAKVI